MKMAFDNEYTIIKKEQENCAIEDTHASGTYNTLNTIQKVWDRLIQIEADYIRYKMYEQWHPFPIKDAGTISQLPSQQSERLWWPATQKSFNPDWSLW